LFEEFYCLSEDKKMKINEIAPDVYRFSLFVPQIDLQFNQFLIKDEEPILFHTGMRAIFPLVREAVSKVINPADLRWISFSHFEADECGSLNEWLEIAPQAEAVCSQIGAMVNVNDFASRPAKGLTDSNVLETGKYRFRYIHTPHLPHGWDAGSLFEETNRTLFCSDLFHQNGDAAAFSESNVIERVRDSLIAYQTSPLADYLPYSTRTESNLEKLACLQPKTIVPMHGSAFNGNEQSLRELADVMRETLA
jgi:flavorubredoxin